MNYLLDTHTFLWLMSAPELVSPKVLGIVQTPASVVALSIITPWEIAIKTNLGKLNAAGILDSFDQILKQGRYAMVETTPALVIRSGRLPLHHRDPFDRMLIAQAVMEDLLLVSNESIFDAAGVRRYW